MVEQATYDLYELRGGSDSLQLTYLIQEVEAATIEDVLHHVDQTTRPGIRVWIVDMTGMKKPFVHIPVKVNPADSL
jgi:hypothetical protein